MNELQLHALISMSHISPKNASHLMIPHIQDKSMQNYI